MKTAILFPPLMKIKNKSYIDFYEEFAEVREKFEEASDILKFDLANKFFSNDEELINNGVIARSSTVAICSAIHDMTKDIIPKPDYYLGPSLGLINSIHCSGRMSFSATLKMIKAMVEIETSEIPKDKYGVYFFYNIETELLLEYMKELREQGGILEPCMFGNATQMIVNGDFTSLEKLSTKASKHGGLGVIVPYGPPSHCKLLVNVERKFETEYAPFIHLDKADIPLISNIMGKGISSPNEIKHELIKQYTSPVLWYDSLKFIYSKGVRKVTILGPGQFITKSLHFTDIPFKSNHLLSAIDIKEKLVNLYN